MKPKGNLAVVNTVNAGLMAGACVLAHLAPADTLLVAYAFLGPAHYLTQISWMHDRDYFVPTGCRSIAGTPGVLLAVIPLMVLGSIVMVFSEAAPGLMALGAALGLACAMATGFAARGQAAAAAAGAVLLLLGMRVLPLWAVTFGILVPTVAHVFAFTGAFIVSGSIRSRSRSGLVSTVVYVLCAASFAFEASGHAPWASAWATRHVPMFGSMAEALARTVGAEGIDHASAAKGGAILGFLGWAYCYHYLNWFSKTSVIGWHRVGARRAEFMLVAWLAISAAYLVNYPLGFLLSLPLSLIHVFLELPLDAAALRHIGRSVLGFFLRGSSA